MYRQEVVGFRAVHYTTLAVENPMTISRWDFPQSARYSKNACVHATTPIYAGIMRKGQPSFRHGGQNHGQSERNLSISSGVARRHAIPSRISGECRKAVVVPNGPRS